MIEMKFEMTPPMGEYDLRPVGDAMHEAGEALAGALKGALTGAVFPGMTGPVHMKDAQTSHQSLGELEFTVTGPDVSSIEEGKKPWDMKPAIYSGPRHRVAKDGHWYVIVPFFHDRDKMPNDIGAMADQLETSKIIGSYIDGLGVERNTYQWGETENGLWQLGDMSHLVPPTVSKTGYQRKTSRYSGMVKMKDSGFMTFRVASEKSPPESWWHPGTPSNPVTESVWNFMHPLIEAHLTEAWGKVFLSWLS